MRRYSPGRDGAAVCFAGRVGRRDDSRRAQGVRRPTRGGGAWAEGWRTAADDKEMLGARHGDEAWAAAFEVVSTDAG